jgi:hypothetical protein
MGINECVLHTIVKKNTMILGSLMGDEENVMKQIAPANVQFKLPKKGWSGAQILMSRMNTLYVFVFGNLPFHADDWAV